MLIAASLIFGALCWRTFVSPARNVLPQPHRSSHAQHVTHVLHHVSVEDIPLPINSGATLAGDIISMHHSPNESAVVITLHPDGRCPKPYLRGRLSGPALVMLDWSFAASQNAKISASVKKPVIRMIGKYQVPIPGTYFFEIIAITCYDFSQDLDFDFQETCLEDIRNNRITEPNTKLQVQLGNMSNNNSINGYWFHRQQKRH